MKAKRLILRVMMLYLSVSIQQGHAQQPAPALSTSADSAVAISEINAQNFLAPSRRARRQGFSLMHSIRQPRRT